MKILTFKGSTYDYNKMKVIIITFTYKSFRIVSTAKSLLYLMNI